MKLFNRIGNLFGANALATIEKMEDPSKMLKYAIHRMEKELEKGKEGLVQMVVAEKQLGRKMNEVKNDLVELERKIKFNLDNKETALELITLKKEQERILEQYKNQLQIQEQYVEKVKVKLRRLDAKITTAKAKKDVLLARENCATVIKAILKDIPEIDSSLFDKAEEKIEAKEIYAETLEEFEKEKDLQYSDEVVEEYEKLKAAK